MSNVRDLALINEWYEVTAPDASTANTTRTTSTTRKPKIIALPPLSPTSPKATKFCCCPNRRRYNVKQSKKSTLHARNIFATKADYTQIDDVTHSTVHASNSKIDSNSSRNNSNRSRNSSSVNQNNNKGTPGDGDIIIGSVSVVGAHNHNSKESSADLAKTEAQHYDNNHQQLLRNCNDVDGECDKNEDNDDDHDDDDDYDDVANNTGNCGKIVHQLINCDEVDNVRQQQQLQQQCKDIHDRIGQCWRHDKSCQSDYNNSYNDNDDQYYDYDVDNEESCCENCSNFFNEPTTVTMRPTIIQQQQKIQETTPISPTSDAKNLTKAIANNICTVTNGSQSDNDRVMVVARQQHKNDANVVQSFDTNDKQAVSTAESENNKEEESKSKCQSNCNNKKQQQQQQQPIQRLSNSEFNNINNNKENNISNGFSFSNCSCIASSHKKRCKNCHQLQQQQQQQPQPTLHMNNKQTDLTRKMTITTTATNVASNRKRNSESGLATMTTSAAAVAAVSTTTTLTTASSTASVKTSPTSPATSPTTMARPTTPVTTVIKTTMVKRSPTNDVAARAKSPTGFACVLLAKNAKENKSNESAATTAMTTTATPTTRTVKERIAALALAGGSEQAKNHDNLMQTKYQCNKNQSNMTSGSSSSSKANNNNNKNTPIKSAINSLQHNQQQSAISSNSSCSTSSSATSSGAEKPHDNIAALPAEQQQHNLESSPTSDLNVTQVASLSTATTSLSTSPSTTTTTITTTLTKLVGNTGCATMPRRRSPALAANERHSKYGSNSDAMTIDKKFLSNGVGSGQQKLQPPMLQQQSMVGSTPNHKQLAALDNLDLALNLDLADDDGDDPYFVLQEYLERVKNEINEVFELHKARQRIQKMQEEQQQKQENLSTDIATTTSEYHNDELSHSTESDSGFDSATCGHNSSCNVSIASCGVKNKSPQRFTGQISANGDQHQHHAEIISTPAAAAASTLTTEEQRKTITKLKALPPPPISPTPPSTASTANENNTNDDTTSTSVSTLKRLRQQLQQHVRATDANATTGAVGVASETNDDLNIWANKFLRDLDNLMATSDKLPTSSSAASSPTSTTSPMLLSAAATAAIQSRYGKNNTMTDREHATTAAMAANGIVLRPEKHATIPLQSFNLDCGRIDNSCNSNNATATATTKTNVAYMRTLSAPTPPPTAAASSALQLQNDNKSADGKSGKRNSLATFSMPSEHHTNFQHCQNDVAPTTKTTSSTTILKIEETAVAAAIAAAAAATSGHEEKAPTREVACNDQEAVDKELLQIKRQHQCENDMETKIRNSDRLANSQSQHQSSMVGMDAAAACMLVASGTATSIPKRERINHTTAVMQKTALPLTTTTTPTTTTMSSINFISPPAKSTLMTPSKTIGSSGGGGGGVADNTTTTNATTTKTTTTTSYLLNGSDATKKGSTSTIWTSEESILRSVGAVDEDNNSTSSSACEEASGVLSSGKSGISLDSSGLDNDNNESGIGTATPPKDMPYWKSIHNDNESVSSLDALRKMKFQKSNSVVSSDDPDLLEVLSLCDEPHGDEDICDIADESMQEQQQKKHLVRLSRHRHHVTGGNRQLKSKNINNNSSNNNTNGDTIEAEDDADVDVDVDEEDEGHDEFETVPFCDCDYTDGDASSASGSGGGGGSTNSNRIATTVLSDTNGVILRRKYSGGGAMPVMVPYGGRAQKCRSHSLETSSSSSLPSSYPQHQHLPTHHHYTHYPHHPHAQLSRKLHHLHNRTKERGQLSLALRQEPFQSMLAPTNFHDLPSPSSASLHSGHENLGIQELTTKSNSAPLLLKQEKKRDDFAGQKLTLRYSRSQSDRYLAEIEAVEACKWLRAAGFPQYAQMYEDHQFPIDLTNVAKDHTNLENDQLQSLYRRLCILNRCASMRLDQSHKTQTPQKEDSDDENFALSENWTFQPHIRRWSRIGEMGLEIPPGGKLNIEKTESSSKESSPDRFDDDPYDITGAGLSLTISATAGDGGGGGGGGADGDIGGCGTGTGDSANTTADSADISGVRLRRTGSERFKDGAKALLRRVESIKSRRRKRQNREGIVISGPQALDLQNLGQRSSLRKPDAVYSTPPSPSAVSPMHTFPKSPFFGGVVIGGIGGVSGGCVGGGGGLGNELKVPSHSENFLSPNRTSPKRMPTTPRSMRTSPLHFFSNPMPHLKEGKSDDSSSYYSDSQESSAGGGGGGGGGGIVKSALRKAPSKTRRFLQRTGKVDDIGAHSDSECHHGRKLLIKDANSNTTEVKIKKLTRGGSLNLGKDPKKREGFRTGSFRSRSTTRKEPKTDDVEHVKRAPVVRWHSFQMEERPHMIFRKCFSQKIDPHSNEHGISFAAMSAGQLQIIRKLALVILTGHMERYCPTHRSGWNWELPKFIKKIKMPDYKDKKVFGVPLLLILQRTGQTLPIAVRAAFRWLQLNALDQIGLFRKSGVKSRIIKLKEMIEYGETTAECMDIFDTQQAYDVADMLKQYFRDLPESLLTTKMSETFAAIFQHLPPDVRLDAVQCAVLLLPDENREILYALLEFLTLVACNSKYNQMTSNNLAVCLAPSLFHNSISTGTASVSASPRRRNKNAAGVPDAKELSEAKASHECLAFMIDNYKQIFTASKEKISKCNFGYMEESKPVPLEALGEGMQFHNWRGYLYECTSATIKEGREKTRGWVTITSQIEPNVDIAYKKVGDGHPLRLWRCITDVEGPPKDVLEYITKQRASWDTNLLQSQTVKKLDERTEIFQYALDGQITSDFCVLRSWQTDLPRGACVIVETSIDHAKAKPIYGAVRGVVLASRYLIEPCGSGRSRVMHLARVDIKGKTPEWYNKSYGHICSHYLSRIRQAFKNVADGPESKV